MRQRFKAGLSWLPLALVLGGTGAAYAIWPSPAPPAPAARALALSPQHSSGSVAEAPYAELRRIARNAKQGMSPAETRELALSFARRNVGVELMNPVALSEASVEALADVLTQEQLGWQANHRGIDEHRLLKALNAHLGLDQGVEYLQLHPHDFRHVRLIIWTHVPEVSSGVERKQARKGVQLLGSTMSPIEAFFAADMLLYKKLLYEEFSRTSQERRLTRGYVESMKPGLQLLPAGPRRTEFREHLRQMGIEKWGSADVVIREIKSILEEGHDQ